MKKTEHQETQINNEPILEVLSKLTANKKDAAAFADFARRTRPVHFDEIERGMMDGDPEMAEAAAYAVRKMAQKSPDSE